jgi:hypothetical protein
MRPELVLRGVIPANLMAFDSELEIDEENYRRHLRYLVDTPGVTGITEENIKPYEFDPDLSRQLLEQIGYICDLPNSRQD